MHLRFSEHISMYIKPVQHEVTQCYKSPDPEMSYILIYCLHIKHLAVKLFTRSYPVSRMHRTPLRFSRTAIQRNSMTALEDIVGISFIKFYSQLFQFGIFVAFLTKYGIFTKHILISMCFVRFGF